MLIAHPSPSVLGPALRLSLFACLAAALALGAGAAQAQTALRLATTTSTQNSGVLDDLLPRFESERGIKVHVIAVGTGKALELGAQGDVDMVMVHAPDLELDYVGKGAFIERTPVMFNEFVILGPPADPARVRESGNIAEAMRRIALGRAPFISRGDRSGTHIKEQELWKAAGIEPVGSWYQQVGQGMGATLRIAHERQSYTLSDDGTYFAFESGLELKILSRREPLLVNPYAVMLVNPARHPHVHARAARELVQWLASEHGQSLIGDYVKHGHRLFTPGLPPEMRTAR